LNVQGFHVNLKIPIILATPTFPASLVQTATSVQTLSQTVDTHFKPGKVIKADVKLLTHSLANGGVYDWTFTIDGKAYQTDKFDDKKIVFK
jgi:hypothetical protein